MSGEFTTECKNSAFFWWGVTMFFLVLFYPFWIFNIVLQSIVNYRLDILIIFVAITLSMIIPLYPMMQDLKSYSKNVSRKLVFLFIIVLFGIIYTDAIYSLLDIPIIIGKLSTALSEKILDNTIIIQALVQFLVIPLLYAIIITLMKKELTNKNFKLDNEFKNNYPLFGVIVLINSIGCFVSYLIVK